jgi:hypothetical protein
MPIGPATLVPLPLVSTGEIDWQREREMHATHTFHLRDRYQAELQQHEEKRSGHRLQDPNRTFGFILTIRFDIFFASVSIFDNVRFIGCFCNSQTIHYGGYG